MPAQGLAKRYQAAVGFRAARRCRNSASPAEIFCYKGENPYASPVRLIYYLIKFDLIVMLINNND